jgi:putative transposase
MLETKWRHFEKDIIMMAVRWYVAYPLSYRHVEELLQERGVNIDHTTIYRWVIAYSEKLESTFRQDHKLLVVRSWRMDETYIKIKGKWHYLYRAVDKAGQTIDFYLSETRDKKAAKAFFSKAIRDNGMPEKVTIDKSSSNLSALKTLNLWLTLLSLFYGICFSVYVREIKYLNNIVEQDHRHIKRITKPMLGFKTFASAKATLAGIELHHMLRKGQFKEAGNMPVYEQFYALAG